MKTLAQSSGKSAVEGLSEEVVFQGEAYRMGSTSIKEEWESRYNSGVVVRFTRNVYF